MTRSELKRFVDTCTHVKVGYCCFQDDGISKYDLKEIGYNHGVYGWNWTCYYHAETDTAYISCYRNVPSYIQNR